MKLLYQLTKFRSKYNIKFIEDKDDPWFVYIVYNETKKMSDIKSKMIIKKDIDLFIKSLTTNGWNLI